MNEGSGRIAIVAPMPSELRPVVARLGLARSGAGLFRGTAGRFEIVAATAGVGMKAGAQCASRIIDATSPDHLIVVGIAGGIGGRVTIGDLIVPDSVLDLATGERFHPTQWGDSTGHGTLASSDSLLESPEEARRLAAAGVVAIDMETAAIAGICVQRGCPWSVFRAVSDFADDGTTDSNVLALLSPDGTPDLAAVARFLLRHPHRIPQLVRLARGARAAAVSAARGAEAALGSGWRPSR